MVVAVDVDGCLVLSVEMSVDMRLVSVDWPHEFGSWPCGFDGC